MTKESNKGLGMQMIYADMRKCRWRPRVGTLTMDMSWSTTSLPYWLTYSLHCSEEAGRRSQHPASALRAIHTSIGQSALLTSEDMDGPSRSHWFSMFSMSESTKDELALASA